MKTEDPAVCEVCNRLETPFILDHCQYLICPHKKAKSQMELPLPVRVTNQPTIIVQPEKALRTLWIVTNRPGLTAHRPFVDLFTGVLELKPHSVIRPQDVVFFDGGTDINPKLYGEEPHLLTSASDTARDAAERHAFQRAQAAGAACLGVCRGAQLLCALSGGKLVQHVDGHYTSHLVFTNDGEALLSESSHHQVMWPYEIPHILIAWARNDAQKPYEIDDEYGKTFDDGRLPEMIFCRDTRSLCIQGHTEWMPNPCVFRDFTRKLVTEFLIEGSKN